MRMNRVLTGLISFALVGLAPLATTSATAATEHGAAAARATTAPSVVARESLPKREITSKIVQKGPHKLIFRGKVKGDPAYDHKIVKIQRRIGKDGAWHVWRKTRTDDSAVWRQQVPAPRTGRYYWRAMTPKTKHYGNSYSDVWYTYTL